LQLYFRLADTAKVRGPYHLIRSSGFPIEPGEDADTNPGVFGRSLAKYLAAQMQARGWNVESIIPEDFGYCVVLARKPFLLWIGCGNRSDRTDEWIAFAAAEGARIRRALRIVNPAKHIDHVSAARGEIMKSAPESTGYSLEP
jgi:hypothetical protein